MAVKLDQSQPLLEGKAVGRPARPVAGGARTGRPPRCTHPVGGQTLLELLLVLALILLLASMLVPAWRGQVAAWRLRSAARTVRTVWREARLHAIEGNRVYVFEIVPGTGRYRVRPIEPLADAGGLAAFAATGLPGQFGDSAATAATSDIAGAADSQPWELVGELPAGVLLEPLQPGGSGGEQPEPISFTVDVDWHPERDDGGNKPAVLLTGPTGSTDSQAWVTVAMFYPGGMATDAAVMVASEQLEWRRLVQLRGLTA